MTRVILFILASLLVSLPLAGCGEESAPGTTEGTSVETTTETVETTTETVELSETITMPAGWEIFDAVTVAEVEGIIGRTGYATWHETLSDPAAGKPQGSFFDDSLAASKVNFLVYCAEGQANYDRVMGFVNNPVEVPGDLWDQAVIGEMLDMGDTLAVILARRGDVCIRIRYMPSLYPGLDHPVTLQKLAELLITNIYS